MSKQGERYRYVKKHSEPTRPRFERRPRGAISVGEIGDPRDLPPLPVKSDRPANIIIDSVAK
jgi:hypothetical protein